MEVSRKLSILILNQAWFADELRSRGHRVVTAGWSEREVDIHFDRPGLSYTDLQHRLPFDFEPEVVLYCDNSGPLGLVGLEDLKLPTLFISIDCHHHADWHIYLADMFDQTLIAQKEFLPKFQERHPKTEWLPLWATRQADRGAEEIDVCFRGNMDPNLHPERAKFFKELNELVPVDANWGPYLEDYPRSKIVVNQNVSHDLNFRVFETMICGAMLITPCDATGLLDLFEDGKDLVTYKNGDAQDAGEKVRYYLAHEAERRAIAQRGYEKVLKFHSPMARAIEIERRLLELKVTERPSKYLGASVAFMVGTRICHRRNSNKTGDYMLKMAMESLLKSAKHEATLGPAYYNTLLQAKSRMIERGYPQDAVRMAAELHNYLPSDVVIALSYIESLLETNQLDLAKVIASGFTTDVDEFIGCAPALMDRARAQLGC